MFPCCNIYAHLFCFLRGKVLLLLEMQSLIFDLHLYWTVAQLSYPKISLANLDTHWKTLCTKLKCAELLN